jgi:mannose-6-phosphate isomerase-like protein (cupin superfamily)
LPEADVESQKIAIPIVTTTPFVVDVTSVTGRPVEDGALIERAVLGAHTGAPWLELSVLELDAGRSCTRSPGGAEEVLFVLSGHGTLRTDGAGQALEPESGAYIPAGRRCELSAPSDEELLLVSVRIPEPVQDGADPAHPVVRRLADQAPEEATSDRWFRIISDPGTGLRSATHFVGYIPPGRAPDHFHTYDEVIYLLDGQGAFHAADRSWPIGTGSCLALPARTIHCLENTGQEAMRVVAVFRPGGSPAAAYYPDGTPASYTNESSASPNQEEVET